VVIRTLDSRSPGASSHEMTEAKVTAGPSRCSLLHENGACTQGGMVDPEEVRRRLEAKLPGARIEVANPGGDGEHLEVEVASAAFAGLGLVEQHRMVYAALGDLMPRIHALQLRTQAEGEGVR
jgi:stress-induced morphogen